MDEYTNTCTPIPKPGKAKRHKVDEGYRYEYRERPCLIPGCHATPTAFCHFPHHRGIGGRNAGWAYDEGVPLCDVHHKRLDAQGETWALHVETQEIVTKLAPPFWARVKREAGGVHG